MSSKIWRLTERLATFHNCNCWPWDNVCFTELFQLVTFVWTRNGFPCLKGSAKFPSKCSHKQINWTKKFVQRPAEFRMLQRQNMSRLLPNKPPSQTLFARHAFLPQEKNAWRAQRVSVVKHVFHDVTTLRVQLTLILGNEQCF